MHKMVPALHCIALHYITLHYIACTCTPYVFYVHATYITEKQVSARPNPNQVQVQPKKHPSLARKTQKEEVKYDRIHTDTEEEPE